MVKTKDVVTWVLVGVGVWLLLRLGTSVVQALAQGFTDAFNSKNVTAATKAVDDADQAILQARDDLIRLCASLGPTDQAECSNILNGLDIARIRLQEARTALSGARWELYLWKGATALSALVAAIAWINSLRGKPPTSGGTTITLPVAVPTAGGQQTSVVSQPDKAPEQATQEPTAVALATVPSAGTVTLDDYRTPAQEMLGSTDLAYEELLRGQYMGAVKVTVPYSTAANPVALATPVEQALAGRGHTSQEVLDAVLNAADKNKSLINAVGAGIIVVATLFLTVPRLAGALASGVMVHVVPDGSPTDL